MKIALIGGTIFLGRALTSAARAAGHTVIHLNRGRSNPGTFSEIETIIGDRSDPDALKSLIDLSPDVIIDTCGYSPGVVRLASDAAAAAGIPYCFISTVSVYVGWPEQATDESAPVHPCPDDNAAVTSETYGGLKARCEDVVRMAHPESHIIVRPGLIVGPFDVSDRFAYWVRRIDEGGALIAPDGPDYPTQFIDVRDLADFVLRLITGGIRGTFNADGPVVSLGILLETIQASGSTDSNIVYVPGDVLTENDVQPWTELPLWIPGLTDTDGSTDTAKSRQHGLTTRPLSETVAATRKWLASDTRSTKWLRTLTKEKEQSLLSRL
ncbi:MAG: NAD-dependent epimerase/dehydratase family protein [Armatimonadota bacterium]